MINVWAYVSRQISRDEFLLILHVIFYENEILVAMFNFVVYCVYSYREFGGEASPLSFPPPPPPPPPPTG